MTARDPFEPVHVCYCGRQYVAHEWDALTLVGYQVAEDPDHLLELRNCLCTSTRALIIPGPGFWLAMARVRLAEAHEEARHDLPALAQSYLERAATCMRQADELLKMLGQQRVRATLSQAAE